MGNFKINERHKVRVILFRKQASVPDSNSTYRIDDEFMCSFDR